MTKVNEFKEFVKKNPKLVKFVKNGEMNWQKFYEIYDLYGESEAAWGDYLGVKKKVDNSTMGFNDILGFFKNINIDNVQAGVNNLQRVLGVVQDFSGKDEKPKEEYKPRPIYKHFDD